MIPTHFLFQLAEYEGIAIEWRDLSHIEGIYTYTPEAPTPVIALSKTLHTKERTLRCDLAHELGHHFETAGHHIIAANSTSSIYATKHKHLATKWAVNLLIPTDVFLTASARGCSVTSSAITFLFCQNMSYIRPSCCAKTQASQVQLQS